MYSFVIVLTFPLFLTVNCGELEWGDATEITDNGQFTLQNQHDGKFLTAGEGGVMRREEWRSGNDQKFTFTKNNNSWKMIPLDQTRADTLSNYLWTITDVGHGKYQLQSLDTGLCLQVKGTNGEVVEDACNKDDPKQRWFAAPA